MSDIGRDNSILTYKSQRMPLDRITGGVGVTDTNHSQVHAGNAYHHSQQLSLGNGGTSIHTLDIPAGVYVHFQNFAAVLSQAWSFTLTEGDTPTTGTEDVIIQRNRNKTSKVSALTLHDTAVSVNTVQLFQSYIPGNNFQAGGVQGSGIEWVFQPGKSYTFLFENESAQAALGYMQLDWYEEAAG